MKIIKLEESEFRPIDLITHADKHRAEYKYDSRFINIKSESDFNILYNKIGDNLSRKKVSPSLSDNRYVGYIDNKGRYVKYDRQYNDYLVYNKSDTITLHKKTYNQYLKIRNRDFKQEMPYN